MGTRTLKFKCEGCGKVHEIRLVSEWKDEERTYVPYERARDRRLDRV
jgi:hypothetical protein